MAQNKMLQGTAPYNGIKWSIRMLRSTVVFVVWPGILFYTIVALIVTLITQLSKTNLAVNNQMLTVLGVILGLVISFRTSTAYERWSDGRKYWASIAGSSRVIGQIIWTHVPNEQKDKKTGAPRPALDVMVEKKSMMNLLQAFSVAVKHMLRHEPGIYYADLYPLVSFLPRYIEPKSRPHDTLPLWQASNRDENLHFRVEPRINRTATSDSASTAVDQPYPQTGDVERDGILKNEDRRRAQHQSSIAESVLPDIPSEHPLMPSQIPPKMTIYDAVPALNLFKPVISKVKGTPEDTPDEIPLLSRRKTTVVGYRRRPQIVDSNVPLEITLFLNTYFAGLVRQNLLLTPSATAMINAMTALQDAVNMLERIRNTPLPFAYQTHLRASLWVYLFFLPFQLVGLFGYLTIPATGLVAALLLGFLEIGQEIENPFNYDLNDLDLDNFCLAIQRDLEQITAHPVPDTDDFVFTEWNQPFAPSDRRSAREMREDKTHVYHDADSGMNSIKTTLLRSWKEVDEVTRMAS